MFAGKREERVAVEDSRGRMEKRVGTETMLVDFEDQFAVAAKGPEWAGMQSRVHAIIELANPQMASVRLDTMPNPGP